MKHLQISIEVSGEQKIAGYITGNTHLDAVFQYAPEYINGGCKPISISLPFQEEPFSAARTRNFFEGLLPEGFSRRAVARWIKTDEDDYLTILERLGSECLGAIQVKDPETPDEEDFYEPLTLDEVRAFAAEGATVSTKFLMETHLSLTGASGKAGLFYDAPNNRWFLPKGKAASSHIVKQSHIRFSRIVLNEQLCILAAGKLGISVPDSFIINAGSGTDESILYATERYDRISGKRVLNGLVCPYRLHQEDLAQCMGIAAEDKYETSDSGYLKNMFSLIRDYSSDPIADSLKLWDIIVFNCLLGNTDCHIKNYSLLYGEDMKGIRLAPAYDLLCTRIYGTTSTMSFFIGGENDITKLKKDNLRNAADQAGLGENIAMKHFEMLKDALPDAVNAAARELKEAGYADIMDIAGSILEVFEKESVR